MRKIPSRTSKEVQEKYTKERNTFKKSVLEGIKRKIEVEIGDIKEDDFYPQFKTKHWDNECNFSARYITDYTKGSVRTEGNKVKWVEDKQEVHLYDLDIDEDGGFEIEILLKEKPDTNKFEFSIQTKGFNFYYQPELTEDEKKAGNTRPDNVVGSYAVYHDDKKNNEYRTGKAFHIYRPHIKDADGNETWGKLDINEKKGLLTVIVPESFLNKAVYPVLVDPTFGYTSVGSSTTDLVYVLFGSVNSGPFRIGDVFTGAAGTLDSLHFAARAGYDGASYTANVKVFVNEEDSGGAGTHGQIATATGTAGITSTAAFDSISLGSESITATDYILSILPDENSVSTAFAEQSFSIAYDAGSSNNYYYESATYASPESPWVASPITSTNMYSIYATYTEAASSRRIFNIS